MTGRIYRAVKHVEHIKSPFAVSRLIMMTGVSLRRFGEGTEDDPVALKKFQDALVQVLTPEEVDELWRSVDRY